MAKAMSGIGVTRAEWLPARVAGRRMAWAGFAPRPVAWFGPAEQYAGRRWLGVVAVALGAAEVAVAAGGVWVAAGLVGAAVVALGG